MNEITIDYSKFFNIEYRSDMGLLKLSKRNSGNGIDGTDKLDNYNTIIFNPTYSNYNGELLELSLDTYLFTDFINLEKIDFSKMIKLNTLILNSNIFQGCIKLNKIVLPETLTGLIFNGKIDLIIFDIFKKLNFLNMSKIIRSY
jgi:hypothetical protein